jgi:hypothetical protein
MEVDDQHLGTRLDLLVGPLRVGVERLDPAANRHHDLADQPRPDPAGHPAKLPDHPFPSLSRDRSLDRLPDGSRVIGKPGNLSGSRPFQG